MGYFKVFQHVLPLSLAALVFLAGCTVFESNGDVENADFVASDPFSFDVPVDQRSELRLSGINGTVEIEGIPEAASVIITGRRIVNSESVADAERHLTDIEVRIQERNDDVVVETFQPNDTKGRNYTVNYAITLPADFEVSIVNVNGNVSVEDVTNASVRLVNGNVQLRSVRDNAVVDLTNGTIASFHAVSPENVDLKTTNGEIQLEIPTSTSASFFGSVVNGFVSVVNLDLHDRVSTPTETTGTLGTGDGRIQLSLVNGNIVAVGY